MSKTWQAAEPRWQRWFAWHPVRTIDGGWTWLATVERASVPCASEVPVNMMIPGLGTVKYKTTRFIYQNM